MKFTLANIITLSRLFIAPIFLVCILSDSPSAVTAAIVLFIVGAATDWLDGYLARRYGEVTDHGIFLDPLADKVLTTSAFVALFLIDVMPLWMVIVIVVRDFGTTAMRSIADDRGTIMQTSYAAKVKTFLQMGFIIYALILYWLVVAGPGDGARVTAHQTLYSTVTYYIEFGITLLTIYTAIMYIFTNRHLFSRG
ncbi:MAG: CDP-diacylglycerol--glycerol-3-phosphate 3-phosphatidyltransferase [Ignavibacteria bacterium]|nr:CDP-diacylglycerol--glycerol-3-phosphate 3-phosphatidyltransferase [Ignavibacteria bacterium]MBK6418401.1 CDP-diacylglycerol--glycerol-3-phosphate 3-phosphatidyltransferase [Ignavibacteria bacterium]MBK6761061.1 CDP-diacylglycerol--glycerol-3-phosphate 3-phosphatidyltransferase [Ignavibacteria bacterium]MBK7032081.1 CDP-diacylglycerol--glycerol-3-phosphate 3-phosphatidyltransferase [Ignavibacteria bacterium]MBK7186762.1 CDP-diacylglycerol--glycerol-3-phosphate 3-phosphatidyltransferase [Igna